MTDLVMETSWPQAQAGHVQGQGCGLKEEGQGRRKSLGEDFD